MTKSKSPRKSSPLAVGASINTSNQTKHSIAAAGAALQAATATQDSRASPPPSPRQLKNSKDFGTTPKEVKKGEAAVETINYTGKGNVGSAHSSLGNGVEKSSSFVQDKRTVPLQESFAASIDASDYNVGQDWKLARFSPSSSSTPPTSSPSFSIPLVSGSGSGSGGDSGVNSSFRTIVSPTALSYRSYNLFESLQQDRTPSMDNRQTSHESDSSDSSNDSDMDEDDGDDNSSESSNSSHASEDEDSSEEDEEEDEDESEEDRDETAKSTDVLTAAQKAGNRKQRHHQQRTGSPLLRRTLNRKHIQQTREVQHQRYPSQPSFSKGTTSSTAPFNHFDPSTSGNGSGKEVPHLRF